MTHHSCFLSLRPFAMKFKNLLITLLDISNPLKYISNDNFTFFDDVKLVSKLDPTTGKDKHNQKKTQ